MTEHRAEVWRDETAPVGGLFAWRSRCTCMGTIAGRDWKPSWTARNQADALAVADHHVREPRSDDWLNLEVRPPERRWPWQRPLTQRDYRLVEGP